MLMLSRCAVLSVLILPIAAAESAPPDGKPGHGAVMPRPTPGHLQTPPPVRPASAWLGVSLDEVDDAVAYHLGLKNDLGVLAREIAPGSPAAQMGLKPFDVIVGIDGEPVYTPRALVTHVAGKQVDDAVTIQVRRGSATDELTGRLAARPPQAEPPPPPRQRPSWWREPLEAWRQRGGAPHEAQESQDPPTRGTLTQPDGSTMEWSIEQQP